MATAQHQSAFVLRVEAAVECRHRAGGESEDEADERDLRAREADGRLLHEQRHDCEDQRGAGEHQRSGSGTRLHARLVPHDCVNCSLPESVFRYSPKHAARA